MVCRICRHQFVILTPSPQRTNSYGLYSWAKSLSPGSVVRPRLVWVHRYLVRFSVGYSSWSCGASSLSSFLSNPSILSNYPHRYISTSSTQGNPYGLCVICAVCFPLFFFARLYCPVPPMLNIVFGVTTCISYFANEFPEVLQPQKLMETDRN